MAKTLPFGWFTSRHAASRFLHLGSAQAVAAPLLSRTPPHRSYEESSGLREVLPAVPLARTSTSRIDHRGIGGADGFEIVLWRRHTECTRTDSDDPVVHRQSVHWAGFEQIDVEQVPIKRDCHGTCLLPQKDVNQGS